MTDTTNTATKPKGQDWIGLACSALGGLFAVSTLLSLLGWESDRAVMRPVQGLIAVLGPWAALVLSTGVAALGTTLFLQAREIAPGKPLLSLVGSSLGLALALGIGGERLGGEVGAILPEALGGGAGTLVGGTLALALLAVSVVLAMGWPLAPARQTRPSKPVQRKPAPRREAPPAPEAPAAPSEPEDGVTAAEAAFLVAAPGAARPVVHPAEDVRVRGGVPEGTRPLSGGFPIDADDRTYADLPATPSEAHGAAAGVAAHAELAGAARPAEPAPHALTPSWESDVYEDELGDPVPFEAEDLFVEVEEPAGAGTALADEDFEDELDGASEDEEPEEIRAAAAELDEDDDSEETEDLEEEEELEEAHAADGVLADGVLEEDALEDDDFEDEDEDELELELEAEAEDEELEEVHAEDDEELDEEDELEGEDVEDEELEEAYAEDDDEELEDDDLEEAEELEEVLAENGVLEEDELEDADDLEEEDVEEDELEETHAEDGHPDEDGDLEQELDGDGELLPAAAGPPPASWEQVGLFDAFDAAPEPVQGEPEEEDLWEDQEGSDGAEEELDEPAASEQVVEVRPAARLEPAPPAPEPEPAAAVLDEEELRELVHRAGLLILEQNRVAVSMLERHFDLDFDQACRVLDGLQEAGLIGPYMGGRHRDILLDRAQWMALAPGVSAAGPLP